MTRRIPRVGRGLGRAGAGLSLWLYAGCAAEVVEETEPPGGPAYETAAPDPCARLSTYDACDQAPEDWYCQWWLKRDPVESCTSVLVDVGCYSLFSQCGEKVSCRDGDCERRCAEGQTCTSFVNGGSCGRSADNPFCRDDNPCDSGPRSLCLPAILPGEDGP